MDTAETRYGMSEDRARNVQATSCPSGRCREGALLLGIVGRDGLVHYLGRPFLVDAEFRAASARSLRPPEARMRFSEPCVQADCSNWSAGRCGVLDRVNGYSREAEEPTSLPSCGIRRTCVWFGQQGASACRICPKVVRTHEPHYGLSPG